MRQGRTSCDALCGIGLVDSIAERLRRADEQRPYLIDGLGLCLDCAAAHQVQRT
jgi:hypothetical protein